MVVGIEVAFIYLPRLGQWMLWIDMTACVDGSLAERIKSSKGSDAARRCSFINWLQTCSSGRGVSGVIPGHWIAAATASVARPRVVSAPALKLARPHSAHRRMRV